MRFPSSKLIMMTVVILIVSYPYQVLGSPAEEQNRIKGLINRTKQEIRQKKKKERSVLTNLLSQQKELEKLRQNYDVVNNQLNQAETKAGQTKRQLHHLQDNLNTLEETLQAQHEQLNRRLVAVYKYGPQTYMQILLSSDSFGDLVSNFGSVAYFIRSDLGLIDEVKTAKAEVSEQHKQVEQQKIIIEAEVKRIGVLQDKVSEEKSKVSQKVTSTKTELTKIQKDRIKLERGLDELEATSRQIEAQIRRIQQGNSGKMLGTGQLNWPARGRISSPFGWRFHPVLQRKKYHSGIDIAIPSGTPVKAADGGVVLVSAWRGGYGNFLAIDHGQGISTCYGHNSRLLVKPGEKVVKGQKVAISGNTGLSTGPHLHFEVRLKGNPVNPLGYL